MVSLLLLDFGYTHMGQSVCVEWMCRESNPGPVPVRHAALRVGLSFHTLKARTRLQCPLLGSQEQRQNVQRNGPVLAESNAGVPA